MCLDVSYSITISITHRNSIPHEEACQHRREKTHVATSVHFLGKECKRSITHGIKWGRSRAFALTDMWKRPSDRGSTTLPPPLKTTVPESHALERHKCEIFKSVKQGDDFSTQLNVLCSCLLEKRLNALGRTALDISSLPI